jgi:hypothetical protein
MASHVLQRMSKMKYTDFRDAICDELHRSSSGKTWNDLRRTLSLPYDRPCPEWICRLEHEIGLVRKEKKGNALIWRLDHV